METKETTRIRGKPVVNIGCKPCHAPGPELGSHGNLPVDTSVQRGDIPDRDYRVWDIQRNLVRNRPSNLLATVSGTMNKWLIKFLCTLAPTQLPLLMEPIKNVLIKHGYDPDTSAAIAGHTIDLLTEVVAEECENAQS